MIKVVIILIIWLINRHVLWRDMSIRGLFSIYEYKKMLHLEYTYLIRKFLIYLQSTSKIQHGIRAMLQIYESIDMS